MVSLLVALGAALAPGAPIPFVATRYLAAIRDLWIRCVLALGALALGWAGEWWLALIALWFTLRFKSPDQHASLLTWVAIGATWFGLRSIPAWGWTYLPWVWLAIMTGQVALIVYRQYQLPRDHPFFNRATLGNIKRVNATHGSPAITALSFALTAPFCPWWLWPVLGVGLYCQWSWLSFIGVVVGMSWAYPAYTPCAFAFLVALMGLWVGTWYARWFTYRGERWFEWVPRGDSFDSVINRLIVWWLIAHAWWTGKHRLLGHGPYSLEPVLRRWATQCWIETPNGEAHVEWAQMLYEYGLCGLVAVGALCVRVVYAGQLGDPFAAAFMAGATMSMAHWAPARHPAVALVVLTCAAGALR
jgi:hypothetical protein